MWRARLAAALRTVKPMPETDPSTHPPLYDQLYDAGQARVHEGLASNRKIRFTKLVRLMEHALSNEPVLYATHSFEASNDPDEPDAELVGTAIAVTSTLIASVKVEPHKRLLVRLTPLNAVSALTVSAGAVTSFVSSDAWNGVAVSATFGNHAEDIAFPSIRFGLENAERFAAFYPTLLGALRAQ